MKKSKFILFFVITGLLVSGALFVYAGQAAYYLFTEKYEVVFVLTEEFINGLTANRTVAPLPGPDLDEDDILGNEEVPEEENEDQEQEEDQDQDQEEQPDASEEPGGSDDEDNDNEEETIEPEPEDDNSNKHVQDNDEQLNNESSGEESMAPEDGHIADIDRSENRQAEASDSSDGNVGRSDSPDTKDETSDNDSDAGDSSEE